MKRFLLVALLAPGCSYLSADTDPPPQVTVYRDAKHASCVILPVIP